MIKYQVREKTSMGNAPLSELVETREEAFKILEKEREKALEWATPCPESIYIATYFEGANRRRLI